MSVPKSKNRFNSNQVLKFQHDFERNHQNDLTVYLNKQKER